MTMVFTFLILFNLCVFPVKADDLKLAENAKSAILIEASTGKVLFEKNADEKLHPASMTKMMSMLLIIEAIEDGVIKWDQVVQVSENASSMGGSQILLETGEKMSVRDLFKGVAIASGNDAVVALAETVAGSVNNFVSMMNKRASELGLTNTNFKNPHGLDDANHYSSSRDMSIIARELVKHKEVLEYTKIYEDYLREDTDRKIWLVNTNRLVRFYDGVDGLKTGYTEDAGYCMTATAEKDGMRIIAVVMGEETSKIRNQEVSEMLDYAFAQYKTENLLAFYQFCLNVLRQLGIVAGLHCVLTASLCSRTHIGCVSEHLGKGDECQYLLSTCDSFHTLDLSATRVEVAYDIAHVLFGNDDIDAHDGLHDDGICLLHSVLKRHRTCNLKCHFG